MMGSKESPVEQHFVTECERLGAKVRKVTYQGRKGAPDRWAFFPRGDLLIFEAKASGEKPEPLQLSEMKTLRAQGQYVAWGDCKYDVDMVIQDFMLLTVTAFNRKWSLT